MIEEINSFIDDLTNIKENYNTYYKHFDISDNNIANQLDTLLKNFKELKNRLKQKDVFTEKLKKFLNGRDNITCCNLTLCQQKFFFLDDYNIIKIEDRCEDKNEYRFYEMKYSNTAQYYCGNSLLEVTIRDSILKIRDTDSWIVGYYSVPQSDT